LYLLGPHGRNFANKDLIILRIGGGAMFHFALGPKNYLGGPDHSKGADSKRM